MSEVHKIKLFFIELRGKKTALSIHSHFDETFTFLFFHWCFEILILPAKEK